MKENDLVLVVEGKYTGIQGRITELASDPSGVYYKIDSVNDFVESFCVIPWNEHYGNEDSVPTVEFQLDKGVSLERHGNWTDIVLNKSIKVKAGEYIEIPLGVRCKLPNGYEAHILPRSSTFRKFGLILANNMGIVDSDYNLEWCAFMMATKDTTIPKGSRIVQFTVEKTLPFEIKNVDKLSFISDRGLSGSSGV